MKLWQRCPDWRQLDVLRSPAPPFNSVSASQPVKWLREGPLELHAQSTQHQARPEAMQVLAQGSLKRVL